MPEPNAQVGSETGEQRQLREATGSSTAESAAISQAISDAWGPRTQSSNVQRSLNNAQAGADRPATPEAAAQAQREGGIINQLQGDRNGDAQIQRQMRPLNGINNDGVGNQLDQAINQAMQDAMRNVLNNPRWDIRYAGAIQAADRTLAQHPKIATEIKLAMDAMKEAGIGLQALQDKVNAGVSALPEWEQKLIHRLENSKNGQAKLYEYLKENHPDLYQKYLNRDKGAEAYGKAKEQLHNLQQIADGPVNSRLDYANFLARRGNKEDMQQLAALLTDVVNKDGGLVNPYKQREQFHQIRNLARLSGADQNPAFLKALKDAGIKPEVYFSPKFDQHFHKKMDGQMFRNLRGANVIEMNNLEEKKVADE